MRLAVAPTHWVDRALVVGAWVAVDSALRLGVPLPRLASICRTSLIDGSTGSMGSGRNRRPSSAESTDPVGVALPAVELSPVELSPVERRRLAAVRVLAARWPFGAGPCLRLSLVAGYVLRRHQPCLLLGVAGGPDEAFAAHAWLELADGSSVGYSRGFLPLQRPAGR